jgi:hypothetical protein
VNVRPLLDELCVDLGFCLPPDKAAARIQAPPTDVESFTDAVFVAEGLDPMMADKRVRRQVRERVARAFGA